MDKDEMRGPDGSQSDQGGAWADQPRGKPHGFIDPSEMQEIDDDEVEIVDDLGNEFDDTEGWMSERVDYWATLPKPPIPTRDAWLRHRIAQAVGYLQGFAGLTARTQADLPVPESEWIRLYETEFGPVPRTIDPVCGAVDGDRLGEENRRVQKTQESNGIAGAKTAEMADFEILARRAANANTTPSSANGAAKAKTSWTPSSLAH